MIALRRSAWPATMRRNLPPCLRVVGGAVEQRLDETLDRRDRRLELVRDVGHEVAAHRLEALEAGHVVEHDHRADGLVVVLTSQQGAVGLERAVVVAHAQGEFALHGGAPGQRLGDGALEFGVARDLLDAATYGGAAVGAKQTGGRLVQGDHALVRVDGDHALDHADEHGLALVALARERPDLLVELLGHAVEALRDLGELLRTGHGELVAEVAVGEPAGAVAHEAHLPADASRDEEADQCGGRGDDGRPDADAPVERGQGVVDGGQRHRGAHRGAPHGRPARRGRRRTSPPCRAWCWSGPPDRSRPAWPP